MAVKLPAYVDVILPLPLPNTFTYGIEEDLRKNILPGMRVIVQFGTRKFYTAIIKTLHNNKPKDYSTKDIVSLLDEKPIITPIQLVMWEWMASYYMCTSGEVYKAALPSGLKLESETNLIFNEEPRKEIPITQKERLLLDLIKDNVKIRISELPQVTGAKTNLPLVKSLLEKCAISLEENLKETYKPKYEKWVQFAEEFTENQLHKIFDDLQKAPKQLELLMVFITLLNQQKNQNSILQKQLLDHNNATHATLNSLIRKRILTIIEEESSRLKTGDTLITQLPQLNNKQQQAFNAINDVFKDKDVALLHGVTSSGKTEIYIQLIKDQIDQGKEVLYLLPEIALTTQIINRLKKVFGNAIGVYHSKFSDAERVEIWNNILSTKKEQKFKIIIGVRSSVFLPFNNLGLVIVDEEHENTYKQYDPAPRYHARDAAIYLAGLHKAKTLLGTATPSIETYFNAKNGKYGLIELKERYTKVQLPEIHIIDTAEAYRKKKMKSHFSPFILSSIENTLANHEQVILFQNRRGFSPFVQCDVCNWIPYCTNCNVSLTYHKHINRLICHYCGHSEVVPKTCKACGSPSVKTKGMGTEKIEDEIKIFFPEAHVARLDLDTTRSRKSYEKIITDFENQYIDILIGTQMITKGLDFNHVNLVGIINADNMLNFPDFRAFERSYQLMVQVSGRAGRQNKRGIVVIQSSTPQHPVLSDVLDTNYKRMYLSQLADRKQFRYPPIYRLIYLNLKHKQRHILNKAANELSKLLRQQFGNRILGPEFPPVDRIQKWYIKQIIVKIEKEKPASKAKALIHESINYIKTKEDFKSLQVIADVDPM